jgi:hypothetical protein
MKKSVYKYPDFVQKVELEITDDKRFWLKLTFDKSKKESIVVILKNPSRANKEISDKTVYNVSNYIYRNQDRYDVLKGVGSVIVLNLIPNYQTYSNQLKELNNGVICAENLSAIDIITKQNSKVIIAWGNHPAGLSKEYETLKKQVMNTLSENNNEVFYVDKLSAVGNPKHGQVWGYENDLKSYI